MIIAVLGMLAFIFVCGEVWFWRLWKTAPEKL